MQVKVRKKPEKRIGRFGNTRIECINPVSNDLSEIICTSFSIKKPHLFKLMEICCAFYMVASELKN